MPELPEVETIRRGLQRRLAGARIDAVEVRDRRLRQPVSVAALRRLVGHRVTSVERRAKYLLMPTSAGMTLVVHLGMSGRILLHDADKPIEPHDHVSIWLTSSTGAGESFELRYRDPRRFGLVVTIPTARVESHSLFKSLGREPLDDIDADYLAKRAGGSRRPIKNFLMDARVVVGVGNIYASETLWLAGVHPGAASGRLGASRWRRIVESMQEVLRSAIAAGGTTLADYRDAEGNLGYFGTELRVYGREGERCDRCDGTIRKRVDAGRSTYYCGRCQH